MNLDSGAFSTKPHLLLGGWYKPGSGFTRVLLALLPYLQKHFRVTWMGVGYRGAEVDLCEGVRLIPTNIHGGDTVGAYHARLNWESLAPDLVFVLNDLWYLPHYTREFNLLAGPGVPLLGYLPLDGGIDDPELTRELTGFHQLSTYTEWAAGELRKALKKMEISCPVTVAGHGVDLAQFNMLPGGGDLSVRMERAQRLFDLDEPAFVVLNASRPDPRKRIEQSLEAFALFAEGKPDYVKLCLHQAISHDQFVAPLRQLVEKLGIGERLLWFPPVAGPLDDAGLNELYNACAVGLNTALGEGFGLVSVEHAATGAPQVLPAHPALCEIWREHAEMVRPVHPVHTEHSPLVMGEVDTAAVAAALQRLYENPAHFRKLSRAGLARCQMPDFKWSAVAEPLIKTLLSAVRARDICQSSG